MKLRCAMYLIRWCLFGVSWLLFLSIGQGQTNEELFRLNTINKDIPNDFQIDLRIVKLDKDNFQLVSTIDLVDGSYIISPLSKDNFYLPYTTTILENTSISASGDLLEFPESIKELDFYIEQEVRLIRTKTVFTQAYKIISQNDFTVNGLIEFLVEPACIPYDLNFQIKSHAGILTIENKKSSISPEYKR